MSKTIVIPSNYFKCKECDADIYICDECGEYFTDGQFIICEDGNHYCEECYNDKN